MRDQDERIFILLFKAAAEKCFGQALSEPLSEVDSKHFSTTILEKTGLVIGPKSLRNYSIYVTGGNEGRKENPSVATLDTLARYVVGAPRTDEATRKETESHFPYWFQYKTAAVSGTRVKMPIRKVPHRRILWIAASVMLAAGLLFLVSSRALKNGPETYVENFSTIKADSLTALGWKIHSGYETPRGKTLPSHLELLTLPGDNWGGESKEIKSMLWRRVSSECFTTEIHLSDFFPDKNWQQAGLLLSEDDSFSRKAIRLAVSFNNFFGGYVKEPEILIQAVSSTESGDKSKPEEIAHLPIFTIAPETRDIVRDNLKRIALKVERKGKRIRLLYAIGQMESFAFKEVIAGDFNFSPKFIAIYASQGLSAETVIPVYIDSFSISEVDCALD